MLIFRDERMYQIINYDQDTKSLLLFYDNIGKSKISDYHSTPVIPQKKMVGVQLILRCIRSSNLKSTRVSIQQWRFRRA
jgi:hypothetical protein